MPRRSSTAARERGIDGLLANPQTLEMLADVVAPRDEWPKSRKETFEMACGQMVREHNEEHQAARESGSPPEPDRLLDAAGRLCALQLISGGAGYTLRGEPDEGLPRSGPVRLRQPSSAPFRTLHQAVQGRPPATASPPFTATSPSSSAPGTSPGSSRDGLPARRVISLMAGEDGDRRHGDEGPVRLARGSFQGRAGGPHRTRSHRRRAVRRYRGVLLSKRNGPCWNL